MCIVAVVEFIHKFGHIPHLGGGPHRVQVRVGPGKTDADIIWAGSDDGLVHVTRDGGKTWTNVTPPDMPEFGRVSQIDASQFNAGTAYIAVKKMLLGDTRPYIFRTRDFGKTWTKLVSGIAENDYVHAVREDRVRRGLLYAGTQHGFYISYDDGERWQSLRLNLPGTQVSDIWVEANAIAIATHGRGFYVLDNIAALRQYGSVVTSDVHLFRPADAIRGVDAASIEYWLKAQPKNLKLEILDARGRIVRSYPGTPPPPTGGAGEGGPPRPPGGAPMAAGLNRFAWNLQSEPVVQFSGMILWGATTNGPTVLPGSYQVRMTVDGTTQTQSLIIQKHPLRDHTESDLQAQFDLASQIRDKVNEANNAVLQIRRIKDAVRDRLSKSQDGELKTQGERLRANLSAVEEEIYQVRNQSNQDPLNFPIKTNNRLASLLRVVQAGDGRPTNNVYPIFEELKAELKAELDKLQRVLAADLPPFNSSLQRLGLEPVSSSN